MKKGHWDIIHLEYDNEILRLKPESDMVYELDDIKEFHQFVIEFTGAEKHLVLSDFRKHHLSLSKETMQFAAKSEWLNELKIAEAILIDNLPNLLIARFFINVLKPITPTKIFKQEKNARKWLELMRRKNLVA